jgi:hypothetical protein
MRTRLRRLALAGLLACGSLGCWVLDEVDSSAELMKKSGPQAADAKRTPGAPDGSGDGSEGSGPSWWEGASSIDPGELDEEIVRCDLGRARTEFMPRPDCLTRGGVPAAPRG